MNTTTAPTLAPAGVTDDHAEDRPVLLAVSYLRVSTREQAERGGTDEGFSIPAQREANQRKADELGARIVARVHRRRRIRTLGRPRRATGDARIHRRHAGAVLYCAQTRPPRPQPRRRRKPSTKPSCSRGHPRLGHRVD